jgi:hypothetical protein
MPAIVGGSHGSASLELLRGRKSFHGKSLLLKAPGVSVPAETYPGRLRVDEAAPDRAKASILPATLGLIAPRSLETTASFALQPLVTSR